jgi:SAM-dependent methyltransferase
MNYRRHVGYFVYQSGRFLRRLGGFISSLIVVIMKPNDLMDFTRFNYRKKEVQDKWGKEVYISKGFNESEIDLLSQVPFRQGRVLLVGLGGGREAIPLAKMGFEVIGIDFVFEMAAKAKAYASAQGVKIEAIVQEITHLTFVKNSFDLVWFTNEIYSFIPSRTKRLDTLTIIGDSLRPDGYFLCSFHLDTVHKPNPLAEFVRKLVAVITLGNRCYETGDSFTMHEFLHTFLSVDEITAEFIKGGFEVLSLDQSGDAVLKKSETESLLK